MAAAAAASMTALKNRDDAPEVSTPEVKKKMKIRPTRAPHTPKSYKEFKRGGWEGVLPMQDAMREFYERQSVQVVVAVLIVLNFCATIAEKEIDPYPRDLQVWPELWHALDMSFTLCFVVELLFNMYASCGRACETRRHRSSMLGASRCDCEA